MCVQAVVELPGGEASSSSLGPRWAAAPGTSTSQLSRDRGSSVHGRPKRSRPSRTTPEYLHYAAPHTQLLGFLAAAPDPLRVLALHLVALVTDAGRAPVASRRMRLLSGLGRWRVPITQPVACCARIALSWNPDLGAEEAHEVGAAPVHRVALQPEAAPLRSTHP